MSTYSTVAKLINSLDLNSIAETLRTLAQAFRYGRVLRVLHSRHKVAARIDSSAYKRDVYCPFRGGMKNDRAGLRLKNEISFLPAILAPAAGQLRRSWVFLSLRSLRSVLCAHNTKTHFRTGKTEGEED